MRRINKHIVHCSDSEYGDVSEIRKWHLANGWSDVGYHFVIRRDGEVEVGRMLEKVGAHVKGENHDSIGTCLIGRKEFTEAQFKSLRRLDESLKKVFVGIETFGHKDFTDKKTCPNFDVHDILKE